MFTIFGANGNTGSVVARTLLSAGKKVRVVARQASKVEALAAAGAEVFAGDVLDEASVAKALEGAEGAYFLIPPDPASTAFIARGKKIADGYAKALGKSSVKHAVLLSSVAAQHAEGTGPIRSAHYAEQALGAVPGVVFTFIRAAYFMENILGNAHPMKTQGVLPVFGGGESFAFPMIATRDIGEVAAAALLQPPKATEIIELSAAQNYSFEDAAREASTILGRPVKATAVPIDAMVPTLTGFGFSADVAGLYREMTEGLGKGVVAFDGKGRAVKGKVTLAEVLRAGLA